MNDLVLWRRLVAETLGSAFLAAVVVRSGIAAQQLSPGNTGLQLLENAAATAGGLYALILMMAPVSGAHFNPVVSFVDAALGRTSWRHALIYLSAQTAGCIGGAVVANLMFSQPAVSFSTHHRATGAHFLSEVIATAGPGPRHLRPGPQRPSPKRPGRRRRVHRRRLLLHQLDQLRQSRHHRRTHPLQHLRRDRSVVRAGLHRRPNPGSCRWARCHQGPLPRLRPHRSERHRRLAGSLDPQAAPQRPAGHDHRLERTAATSPPVVLFVCTHNAGRSLAAKVLLDHHAQGRVEVRSAGSEPAEQLNPAVVAILVERGLDPSREAPKRLTDVTARTADVVVTMGCGDTCPIYPGTRHLDWDLPDPAGQAIDTVRPIIDEIDRRVRALLAELSQERPKSEES